MSNLARKRTDIFHRPGIGLLLALSLLAIAPADLRAGDLKADPPSTPYELSVKPGMSLVLPNPAGILPLYPSTPSPFVVVGKNDAADESREVWDLRTFQRTGTIKGKVGSSSSSAARVSPDGKYLAVTATETEPDRVIEVWSFGDGKLVRRIEPKPRAKKILAFDFAANNRLVVAVELEVAKLLQVYDFVNGSMLGSLPLTAKFQEESLAMSPGRKTAAFLVAKELRVVDLESRKTLGSLAGDEACYALSFSADGSEIASVNFLGNGGHLKVWDLAKGEVVVDHPLPSGPNFATPGWSDLGSRSVQWLPDGSAWLIAGHALVNRKDGRWVWNVFSPPFRDADGRFREDALIYSQGVRMLDNDHVLAGLKAPGGGGRLEVAAIPWPKIDASVKAADSDGPSLLNRGGSLSLKFLVGSVRFSSPQEVEAGLTAAIAEGLAARGIKVVDGQPVVLNVKYSEEVGPPYRVFGTNIGANTTVNSTRFNLDLALTVPGSKAPVWSDKKADAGLSSFTTARSTGGKMDEAGMRQGGFDAVKVAVKNLGLPYFIPRPQDKDLATLPGTTVLASTAVGSGKSTGTVKVEKATNRGKKMVEPKKKP